MKPSEIRVAQRFYAEGKWTASSPLHLGGEPSAWQERADMIILRGGDGKPFIPGSSLAGAARSLLRGPSGESDALVALFGGDIDGKHQTEFSSPLVAFDAKLTGSDARTTVRDGVRIDPVDGLAMDHFKYDFEVLPHGSQFTFRFLLSIYDEMPHGVDRNALLAAFRALLEGFSSGEIRLGARVSRGLGAGKVSAWKLWRLDTGNKDHLVAWLNGSWKGEPVDLCSLPEYKKEWQVRALEIDATLRLKTSLLNRSGGAQERDPDMVHLCEAGQALLTGSSFAGALRSRCCRIARTLFPEDPADAIVNGMFGPRYDRDKPKAALRASRVRVEEAFLANAECLVQGRVAIDRFTGGALDSALFDEAPAYPKDGESATAGIRIVLRAPTENEMGLLLLAFKDLWLGDLPLNGEAAVGRGVFEGVSASIRHPELGCLKMSSDGVCGKVHLEEALAGAWSRLDESIQNWRK